MPDLPVHLAYALMATSFAVRDMLWLRIISIAAFATLIATELTLRADPRTAMIFWQALFIAVHAVNIAHLVWGEQHTTFTEEEKQLHDQLFPNLTKLEFARLLAAGSWTDVPAGQTLTTQGQPVPQLILLTDGRADVAADDQRVATLGPGQLVGEMSFLTREPASATVTAATTLRLLAWDQPALRRLLTRHPTLRLALDTALGLDLSRKLRPKRRRPASDN